MLILSRASSLTLLAIYLLYIFMQIRKTSVRYAPVQSGSGLLNTSGQTSQHDSSDRGVASSVALLFPRSIRFQDEEIDGATESHHLLQGPRRKGSLEMSSLVSTLSERDPEEEAEAGEAGPPPPFQVRAELWSGVGDDHQQQQEESERGRQLLDKRAGSSRNSIYQKHLGRSQLSGSRHSTNRNLSQEARGSGSHRRSFAGSTSSLPRLLLGGSTTGPDTPCDNADNCIQDITPSIGRKASMLLLVVSSLLVALCAEFLVNTLDDMVSSGPSSQTFIGLIILPIAGNCVEHITATVVAAKGKFDLAIGVSVGSSVQIALFVTPLVVIAGWIFDRDMTMYFGLFETVSLVATTFLVNFLISHGRTNFLEGSLLCACYVIIGVGAFLFPDSENQSGD